MRSGVEVVRGRLSQTKHLPIGMYTIYIYIYMSMTDVPYSLSMCFLTPGGIDDVYAVTWVRRYLRTSSE